MRAGPHHVFHLNCFACVSCEKRLQTGEEFQIKNNSLYCRADCQGIMENPDTSNSVPDYSKLQNNNNNNNDNNNSSSNFDEDEWDEERSTLTSLDNNTSSPLGSPKSDGARTPLFGHHSGSGGSSSSCGKKKKDKQATRVRTVLNEQQLKILKDCYSCNSRPDASLKEKLVEMTGLNARVIRVWFQNKRCKDKKRQIQMTENRLNSEREEVLNRVRINGIGPLMVQPATPHIDSSLATPIDIQHYAQWATTPPPSQFQNPMMFNSPVEMPPFGVTPIHAPVAPTVLTSSDNMGPLGASVFPHYSPQHASLTASSHGISSPTSCSE
uniref:Homeobox domain-containing protein n=1 Tax=Caenorhabditis tropicalis TaxID=1561998 RepID=A0A1I7ULB2_9PELO